MFLRVHMRQRRRAIERARAGRPESVARAWDFPVGAFATWRCSACSVSALKDREKRTNGLLGHRYSHKLYCSRVDPACIGGNFCFMWHSTTFVSDAMFQSVPTQAIYITLRFVSAEESLQKMTRHGGSWNLSRVLSQGRLSNN